MISTKIPAAAIKRLEAMIAAGNPRALTFHLKSNPYPLIYRLRIQTRKADRLERESKRLDQLAANCAKAIWEAEHYEPHKKTGAKRRRVIRQYLGHAWRRGERFGKQ